MRAHTQGMAKKMSKGLVALSSAAIVAVYGAGYALTQPAAVSMAAGQAGSTAPAAAPVSDSTSANLAASPAASSNSAPAATATFTSGQSAGLKDGAYTGTGMSRHGSVSVKVTVQNGKIISAPITGVTTRYSQNVIAGLPAQVVSKQSAEVNIVSGATDSSMAYEQAVAQALAQAGGAPATTTSPTGQLAPGGSVQVTGPNGTIYGSGGGRRGRVGSYSGD
jgi:uncharacterized protein with FMN-binding domain